MKDIQEDILRFWFEDTSPQLWFQVNPDFDAMITEKWNASYEMGAAGHYEEWKNSADGALAYCILLDQMPRNMFEERQKLLRRIKKHLFAQNTPFQRD